MRLLSPEEARAGVTELMAAYADAMKDPDFRREALATRHGILELPGMDGIVQPRKELKVPAQRDAQAAELAGPLAIQGAETPFSLQQAS